MGTIRILPDSIINRIAAGEVITRPAAAVKELLDNSLDAGASRLEITLERGGRSVIQVVDDGRGMDADDAVLAFERHATSKIQRAEDLHRIHTLGFRGEALASIAAVSHVVLETRRPDDAAGTRVEILGGRLKSVAPAALPPGTRIAVKRLFFNVPARRKFLRSTATELHHILELVQHYALAHPEVAFRLQHHDREILWVHPAESVTERIRNLYGPEWLESMLPLEFQSDRARVQGWISGPDRGSRSPDEVHLYVNGRFVRDRWLMYTVRDAWLRYGSRWTYPFVILFLDLDPEDLDVNVHPTKLEMRFHDPRAVREWIRTAIDQAFQIHRPIAAAVVPERTPESARRLPDLVEPVRLRPAAEPPTGPGGPPVSSGFPPVEPPPAGEPSAAAGSPPPGVDIEAAESRHRLLGQTHNCYLVLTDPEGLVLLDQHLVHERYLYETWERDRRTRGIRGSKLLVPTLVDLGPARVQALVHRREELRSWGWEVDAFGPGTLAVYGIPRGLWPNRIEDALLGLVDDFERSASDPAEWERETLKTLACRAAVKKGDRLSREQLTFLARIWYTLEVPQVCPHGRTMALRLTLEQLHRAFGRNWNL